MAQVRAVIRLRHLSYRTEQSYCYVIKPFISYRNKRHPSEMGAEEVTAYLTRLARDRQVNISPNGRYLMLYHSDGARYLCDVRTGEVSSPPASVLAWNSVYRVWAAIPLRDEQLARYDAETRAQIAAVPMPSSSDILASAWSSDGHVMALGIADGTINLWRFTP